MKTYLKSIFINKYFLVFFISFSMLIGTSFNTYMAYERFINPDPITYLNIANGNFNDQSPVRRYRIIVPFVAKLISIPISKVYNKVYQDSSRNQDYDWPLLTSFFLLNAILMSIVSLIIFMILEHFKLSNVAVIISMLAFLTGGRWTGFVTGHPITDSLYILVVSMLVLGVLKQNIILIAISVVFGILSKESYLLFFPLLPFIVSRKLLPITLISMLLSVGIYALTKYLIDASIHDSIVNSLNYDTGHWENVGIGIRKIFSVKGFANIFSVFGFFSLGFLIPIFFKESFKEIIKEVPIWFWFFITIIGIHMLLSLELSRMLLVGAPVLIPILGLCLNSIKVLKFNKL